MEPSVDHTVGGLTGSVRRMAELWRTAREPIEVYRALAEELGRLVEVRGLGVRDPQQLGQPVVWLRRPATAPTRLEARLDAGPPPDAPVVDGDEMLLPLSLHGAAPAVVHLLGSSLGAAEEEVATVLVQQAACVLAAVVARAESRTDPLTGLLNRRAMQQRLADELAHAERAGSALSCLLVDLDGFKRVNDLHGHVEADRALRRVAQAIRAHTRPYDVLARYGGDEFLIGLRDLVGEEAAAVGERIRAAVAAPLAEGPSVTCSIGAAVARPPEGATTLVERTDAALRAAKRRGGDTVATEGMAQAGVRTWSSADARSAVDTFLGGHGLGVVFQPVVELGSRRLIGYEALTRGPQGGQFERPDHILSAAREVGRLVEMDCAMRLVALAGARRAGLAAPATLFVNVEPETLARLIEREELWTRDGAPFESVVEITERALVERPAELLAAADVLRRTGWGIAVDDVGADHRSLALMPFLRPDVVKLDRRLLHEAPTRQLASVVAAVNAYAERSGAVVLAEGIETDRHVAAALSQGATLGQGYRFGRPEPAERLDALPVNRIPNLPAPARNAAVTPFELLAGRRPVRAGSRELVESITRHVQDQAEVLGGNAVVLSCMAGDERLARSTLPLFQRLAGQVAFVGVVTDGMVDAVHPPLRKGRVTTDDRLSREWDLVVVGPQAAVALVARADEDGGYQLSLTHDGDLALEAARVLMSRIAPDDPDGT